MTPAVQFTVWSLNGGLVDEGAITRIEKSITRILDDAERNDGVRYATQTTRAVKEADGNS